MKLLLESKELLITLWRDSKPLNTLFLFSYGPAILASLMDVACTCYCYRFPLMVTFLLLPFLNTLTLLFISSVSYLCLYGVRCAYFVPWTVAPNCHDLCYRSDFPTFLPLATPSGWFFVPCQMTHHCFRTSQLCGNISCCRIIFCFLNLG